MHACVLATGPGTVGLRLDVDRSSHRLPPPVSTRTLPRAQLSSADRASQTDRRMLPSIHGPRARVTDHLPLKSKLEAIARGWAPPLRRDRRGGCCELYVLPLVTLVSRYELYTSFTVNTNTVRGINT